MSNILEYSLFFLSVYYLYNLFLMKAKGEVPKAFISKTINLERAKDIPGFINYMFPRGIIFGFGLLAFSAIIILSSYITVNPYVKLICELLYIVLIIYFTVVSVRAQKKYLF